MPTPEKPLYKQEIDRLFPVISQVEDVFVEHQISRIDGISVLILMLGKAYHEAGMEDESYACFHLLNCLKPEIMKDALRRMVENN